ncbi:hypothetical protein ABEB36_004261 [Hypothenemus hampei]|uniref:Uncharacterized protein n=1 Tax=Hypothenemus hampei TaxID=57062 RepID=A0ABD1F5E8_HYPHA
MSIRNNIKNKKYLYIKDITMGHTMRNKDIKEDCEVQDIVGFVKGSRRQWRAYVDRLQPSWLVKCAGTSKPTP